MLKPGGNGLITDPGDPLGRTYKIPIEHETITCAHCNKIVIVPPGWTPENMPNRCKVCMGYLCLGCWGEWQLGKPCVTWREQIDRMLERNYALRSYGIQV